MGEINEKNRKWMLRVTQYGALVFFAVSVLVYVVCRVTKKRLSLAMQNPLLHMVLPMILIGIAVYVSVRVLGSPNIKEERKNRVAALAMMSMCGAIGVFGSRHLSMWCLAALVILVSTIMQDMRLLTELLLYSYLLTVLEVLVWTNCTGENLITMIVKGCSVLLVNTVAYGLSRVINLFHADLLDLNRELVEKEHEYLDQIRYDNLTGVFSRLYLFKVGERVVANHVHGKTVSIAMIDIDHFKVVNDTFGHENGDVVLYKLGHRLKGYLGNDLHVGRFGGEEFTVIFDGGKASDHQKTLEEMRQCFEKIRYPFTDKSFTFSAGITVLKEHESFTDVIKRADEALYESKRNGRNRVTFK